MESFEQALKTGIALQEETTKWWTEAYGQASSPQEWQKQVKAIKIEMIPIVQKNVKEYLNVINQNTKSSLDLLKKGFEAAPSNSATENQAKTKELWESSLNVLQTIAQAIVKANTQAMKTWSEFVQKSTGQTESKAK